MDFTVLPATLRLQNIKNVPVTAGPIYIETLELPFLELLIFFLLGLEFCERHNDWTVDLSPSTP